MPFSGQCCGQVSKNSNQHVESMTDEMQRFRTYNLPLKTASPEALAWMVKMWNDPVLKKLGKDYFRQAERPETLVAHYDDIFRESNPEISFGRFEEDWEFSPPA